MKHIAINYDSLSDLNIGDYIQSLAARQYLDEEKLVYCERDELNHYNGLNAKLIYNCWFTAKPDNFPPTDKILPLFRSFHLNAGVADKVLSVARNVEYFKKHEPIGCRDVNSAKIFQSYGVNAYFSGCLTTTLGNKYRSSSERKGIYVVDIISTYPTPKNAIERNLEIFQIFLFSFFNIKSVSAVYLNLIANNPLQSGGFGVKFRRWLYCGRTYKICKSLFSKNDLSNINYLTHLHEADDIVKTEDRFSRAEELLKKYSEAELVLSSRIHCILPCLGLNTSSIYFDQIDDHPLSSCRKEGLIELFNVISLNKTVVVENKYGILNKSSNVTNSNDYKKYSDVLTKDSNSFVNERY